MADHILFDETHGSAYVLFSIGSENDVYLEITAMIPATSLANMWSWLGAPGPNMMGILQTDPNFTCSDRMYLDDPGFTGAYHVVDDWQYGAQTTTSPTGDVNFTLKLFMRNLTSVGQYMAFDADVQTIDDSGCGPWVNIAVGLSTGDWFGQHSGGDDAIPGGANMQVFTVKAGTTDGGSDLLNFDASTALNLGVFTIGSGSGSVSLVKTGGGFGITGISTNTGPAGTPVIITGHGFTGATVVEFDGTSASFVVGDDLTIFTTVPLGAGTGHVTVTAPGGTATGPIFYVSVLPAPSGAFFVGYPWRFTVHDLDLNTLTWASGLWRNRTVTLAVGGPEQIDTDLNPDDVRVNLLLPDGYPRVGQSNRIIYAWRRDGIPPPGGAAAPWQPVAAGIIQTVEDDGDVDTPLTHLTAYGPRSYLNARPVLDDSYQLPVLPIPFDTTADQVALEVMRRSIHLDGGVFIDAGVSWGGTSDWAGTIETCPQVNYIAQQGQMVGQVWDDLEAGQLCNIVLTPIYDPNRFITVNGIDYHFTHDLSIYELSGIDNYEAVFGWDEVNHCIAKIARMHDASPGAFFNVGQYYDQTGIPIPEAAPLENVASIADFHRWWLTSFQPSQLVGSDPLGIQALYLLEHALVLAKQGKRTVSLDLIPERAPVWRRDWNLADRINVHASNRLRDTIDGLQRVETIPIQITDDGAYEFITGLLVTPDYSLPATIA